MKRSLFYLALVISLAVGLAALLVAPRSVMAQEAPSEQTQNSPEMTPDEAEEAGGDDFFGESHRRRIYEESRLSTTRAILYNLVIPGAGNVYAEQYLYGGVAMSLMVFAGVFVGYGLYTDQSDFVWTGAGLAGGAYVGSIVTSIFGVRDYNKKLRQGLKLEGAFDDAGPYTLPQAQTVDFAFEF